MGKQINENIDIMSFNGENFLREIEGIEYKGALIQEKIEELQINLQEFEEYYKELEKKEEKSKNRIVDINNKIIDMYKTITADLKNDNHFTAMESIKDKSDLERKKIEEYMIICSIQVKMDDVDIIIQKIKEDLSLLGDDSNS